MGRKKRDGDSSLELLLDTMCNTFGGVMFIAIALVVIMTMLGKVEKKLDLERERAELQQEFEALKQELEQTMARRGELETVRNRLQNDPRREWLSRLLMLERQLAEARILDQTLQNQKRLAERSAAAAEQKMQDALRQNAVLEQQAKTRSAELKKLRNESEQIRRDSENAAAPAMTFRVMERSDIPPYYLIVEKDRLYRVGPEEMKGPNAMIPHPDCCYQKGISEGHFCYQCSPGSPGTPILENGTLSSGAIALLKAIPAGRAPQFSIDKASMKSFCLLREYLKNSRTLHGVNTGYETDRSLSYFLTSKADYEY